MRRLAALAFWATGALATGCGSAKSDDAAVSDVRSTADAAEAGDAPDANDVAEAGCVGVGGQPQDPLGHDCCPGLLILNPPPQNGPVVCVRCIEAGQQTLNTFGADCCAGLSAIVSGAGPPLLGQPLSCRGIDSRVCSACGNGACEDWELPCGCPEDCGVVCGASRCPLGSYCLQTPGPVDAPPMFRCVEVASDCPAGFFSCQCDSAKSACPNACVTEPLTAACS